MAPEDAPGLSSRGTNNEIDFLMGSTTPSWCSGGAVSPPKSRGSRDLPLEADIILPKQMPKSLKLSKIFQN